MKTREQVTLERIGYHVADYQTQDKAKGKLYGDRIARAAKILTQGGVKRLAQNHYEVQSETSAGKTYEVNGECACPDAAKAHLGWCKHRIAVRLYRHVEQHLQELVHLGLPQKHHRYDCDLHRDIPIDCWERACGSPQDITCPTCGPRPVHTDAADPFAPEPARPQDEDARIALDEDLSDRERDEQPATAVLVNPPEDPLPPLILETAQYEPAPALEQDVIVPLLPEAAASLNIKVRMDQFELMYTMRGHSDPEVLERLPQVLATIERLMHAEVDHDEAFLQRLAHAFFPRKRGAYGK